MEVLAIVWNTFAWEFNFIELASGSAHPALVLPGRAGNLLLCRRTRGRPSSGRTRPVECAVLVAAKIAEPPVSM